MLLLAKMGQLTYFAKLKHSLTIVTNSNCPVSLIDYAVTLTAHDGVLLNTIPLGGRYRNWEEATCTINLI